MLYNLKNMLPPGHVAAGYLVAKALLVLAHPALTEAQQQYLLLWGMFFGFAPDLDMFFSFFKMKKFVVSEGVNHRKFFSHAPILWFCGSLVIFVGGVLGHSLFLQYLGIVAWLGSWSHFFFDAIQYGVMWLWPWNKEPLAIFDKEIESDIPPQDFLPFWVKQVKWYMTRLAITFITEVVLIILALAVYMHGIY